MKRKLFCLLVLGLFGSVQSSLRSCNKNNLGRKECLRVPGYDAFQWARCSDDNYIRNVSNGKERCVLGQNENITHYCWYPCQKKYSNMSENEIEIETVHSDCLCRDKEKLGLKYDWTKYIAVENTGNIDPNLLGFKNCSYLNDGKRSCGHHRDYARNQWLQCVSDSHLYQKSKGRFRCRENELFCWLPCQLDKYGLDEGEVTKDCSCSTAMPSRSCILSADGILLLIILVLIYTTL